MDNKEVLNESFFGLFKKKEKPSYTEKIRSGLSQYSPVDAKSRKSGSYRDGLEMDSNDSFSIKDTGVLKQRLSGLFGAVVGNNTVKTLASRSIKKFPIVVSDAVDPNTVVLAKKLLEDQVAEYINLLISNQVIDLSAFSSADPEKGNVALQALDQISGAQFSRQELANKATQNRLGGEDLFSSAPLLFSLIRNEAEVRTGNELFDSLMENCVILPTADVKDYEKFLASELMEAALNEVEPVNGIKTTGGVAGGPANQVGSDDANLTDEEVLEKREKKEESKKDDDEARKKGIWKAVHKSIDTNTEERLKKRLSFTSVATLLNDSNDGLKSFKGNAKSDEHLKAAAIRLQNIKDRYAKAVILLESRQISGGEFIDYCAIRLGIPVSKKTRIELVQQYQLSDLRNSRTRTSDFSANMKNGRLDLRDGLISSFDANLIRTHGKEIRGLNKAVLLTKAGLVTAAGSAIAGIGTGSALAASAGLLSVPIIGIALAAGLVGGVGAYHLFNKIYLKKKNISMSLLHGRAQKMGQFEGWERVEHLITQLERQMNDAAFVKEKEEERLDAILLGKDEEREEKDAQKEEKMDEKLRAERINDLRKAGNLPQLAKPEEVASLIKMVEKMIDELGEASKKNEAKEAEKETVKESVVISTEGFKSILSESDLYIPEEVKAEVLDGLALYEETISEEYETDKEFRAECLSEAVISLDSPTNLKVKSKGLDVAVKKIKYDPEAELLAPSFTKAASYAYGSVQYDRKENKERRFNTPLILKVTFNSKYSDGRSVDNELTAVIGILGVVNRVPSEEMKYILKSNAEGNTIDGILRGEGSIKNAFSELLTGTKLKKEVQNLPQSAEIWHGLEKVASLAAANKLRGSKTNNVSNAHLVFAQKEIDELRGEFGIDYVREKKLAANLLKRYSALSLMIANDAGERMYIFDDIDAISWNVVPYSVMQSRDGSDQMISALAKFERGRI